MTALEQSKTELLATLTTYAESKSVKAAPEGVDLRAVLQAFYRHVAPEDLLERDATDLYGAVMAQLRLAAERPQGTASVRVFTPSVSVNGWSAGGHTVVEVVTDDMPFLVDSVSMALAEEQHDIHLVIHPQYVVRRDLGGQLQEVLDEQAYVEEHDIARESWMHLEIDRVSEDQLGEIRDLLAKVLTDVRDAVEDWERMHAQVERIVEDLHEHPPPLPDSEVEQGIALLRWLADNHFTFLGYREYVLESQGRHRDAGRRARHRFRDPARRPARAAGASRGSGLASTRQAPARPGEGQLEGDRAPPRAPRLRGREEVRRAG